MWNFGTENITTTTPNVSYTFADAIKYQVIVKGIGYCGSKSTSIIVDCSELSVMENTPENTIRVFPNPAKNNLSVLSDTPNLNYAIFSSDGREILNGVLNGITIDIKSIEAGRYILRLEKDGYHHFKHFIKQ